MPLLPVWVAKALKEGWARTFNQFLELDYPPGVTRFNVSPAMIDRYWLVYGWNYGRMVDPSGVEHYDSAFAFEWRQRGIRKFKDCMAPSMMDFTYPVFIIVTREDPVVTIAINDTGETQRIDFTAFLVRFGAPESFEAWSDWFDRQYGIPPRRVSPREVSEALEVSE